MSDTLLIMDCSPALIVFGLLCQFRGQQKTFSQLLESGMVQLLEQSKHDTHGLTMLVFDWLNRIAKPDGIIKLN